MDNCMNNVNQGKSVPQSIELLQKILDEFPAKKRKRATTIEALDQKYKILKVFFTDVVKYKQAMTEKAQKEQAKNKGVDVNKILVDKSKYSHLTHLDQVQLRLNFLSYLRANSSVVDQMNTEQIDTLWNAFITQALSSEEMEITFKWLEDFISGGTLPETVVQHLFDKMLKMDCSVLTKAGFTVFERFFIFINEKNNRIKRFEDKLPCLVAADAIGMSTLWDIALDNKDNAVAEMAINSLNGLHQNFEILGSKSKSTKMREDYIADSMDRLHKAAGQPDNDSNKQRLERTLRLLKNYVENFDKKPENQKSKNKAQNKGERPGMQLKVQLKAPNKQPQLVIFNTTTTLQALKEKAVELFKFDQSDDLRVTVGPNDRELRDDDKTLIDYKLSDEAQITVRKVEREEFTFDVR
jgi:hypothetical protein